MPTDSSHTTAVAPERIEKDCHAMPSISAIVRHPRTCHELGLFESSVFCTLPCASNVAWLHRIPAHLSRRYSWSFCKSASLPRGTVFLKRKKQFAKGRTIISYAQSLCSKLLEMASIALTVIIETRNSDSPGMQSMPQLWKSLHKFLAGPSEEHDVEWNDDLVGFFNAVPRKDMLRSVHTIVREYQQHTGCSVLSIDLLSKTGHPGNPRGRTKSSLKRCCIHDIPAIVELSFSTGAFTAAGKCRAQVEGTAQAQIVESQAVAFASEVQQQAQSHVQAMAADMESQARNRVQAIEQQAQARVSEVSIEASRQLAVANDTIVSLKQQNEMLARQQQDLCGQIATLQNMVAEVKASAVNTSVPQIPTTQNGAEITEALKAMASRVGQTMNALKEAVIGSPKAKGRSKVAKAPIPYFSSPPPYACERSSSVSFDKWGTFINAHCLCSTEICL